jgi:hypothetical protein
MEPRIIKTHTTCRFFIGYKSKKLDPKHFCQLNSRVEERAKGHLRSCTDFTAVPFTYQKVLSNLMDIILTEEEVSTIQTIIALHYSRKSHCYNCHH